MEEQENKYKTIKIEFIYRGLKHTHTFTPDSNDCWIYFKSKGFGFDVNYDLDNTGNISVYRYYEEYENKNYNKILYHKKIN